MMTVKIRIKDLKHKNLFNKYKESLGFSDHYIYDDDEDISHLLSPFFIAKHFSEDEFDEYGFFILEEKYMSEVKQNIYNKVEDTCESLHREIGNYVIVDVRDFVENIMTSFYGKDFLLYSSKTNFIIS